VIIAKTLKGKGIRKVEDKEGFHGKALPHDEMGDAAKSLGEIDRSIRGAIAKPHSLNEDGFKSSKRATSNVAEYKIGDLIATRKAYGETLANLIHLQPSLVVLDAEVSNSTYSEIFRKKHPERYFEMFIAEQNMVSVAVGLARRGKLPFVSTFAAFFTRAHDQIRMAAYAKANIKFVGSHAGVSIGEDGASQMAVEDIAMFRSLQNSVVLYPSDAISTLKLTELSAMHNGLVYIRTTRMETQVIYHEKEQFEIGGSKVLRESAKDKLTVIGAGVTLHETLEAYKTLKDENIEIRVIDLYSIKPIDKATLEKAAD
jgi:transketolase